MHSSASKVDVSVLMPSFNSGRYAVDAARSALGQAGLTLELIVQDGGSTDGTRERLVALGDPRVRLAGESDAGQSDALNRALRRATGEFVIWLNADDLLAPGGLAVLVTAARQRNLDVVHGSYEVIDPEGAVVKRHTSAPLQTDRLLRHGNYVFSGTMLIRRSLLTALGGFDRDLHYCMDYELLLRLASSSCASGSVPDVVAKFRRQPSSKTETGLLPPLREALDVGRRYGATTIDRARRAAIYLTYKLTLPVWRSRLWLRIRPSKHLGGA